MPAQWQLHSGENYQHRSGHALAAMQQQGLTCGINQGSGLSFQLGIVKLALHPG